MQTMWQLNKKIKKLKMFCNFYTKVHYCIISGLNINIVWHTLRGHQLFEISYTFNEIPEIPESLHILTYIA